MNYYCCHGTYWITIVVADLFTIAAAAANYSFSYTHCCLTYQGCYADASINGECHCYRLLPDYYNTIAATIVIDLGRLSFYAINNAYNYIN